MSVSHAQRTRAGRGRPGALAAGGVLWVALGTSACPNTDATRVTIERAEIAGVAAPPSFELDLLGHGFGLRGLTFNLAQGRGTATTALRTEIVSRRGLVPAEVEATRTTLRSSTQLEVEVTLRAPLPADSYGVRLYVTGETAPIAELPIAFLVDETTPPADAGARPDAPASAPDATTVGADATGPADAGDPGDAFFFDASDPGDVGPADSGLGAFLGSFGFRQRIILQNNSGAEAAAGVTFRLNVPHQFLVASGRSRSDGADLAIALDGQILPHAFENPLQVGQPDLYLIVRVPVAVPVGTPNLALALYYGDPNRALTVSDSVFELAERFSNALPGGWQDAWMARCNDRVLQAAQPLGSLCTTDANANPTRRTLGTPNVAALRSTGPANEIYELAAFVGGVMQESNSDLLYFAYSNNTMNFAGSVLVPTTSYLDFPPKAQLTFLENTNAQRNVEGWRFAANQPFTLTRARFRPTVYDQPSLHFRYISANGSNPGGTLVGLDDLTVRRAVEPELGVALDPAVESP